MKITINIPDGAAETTEKGLVSFARRINPKFKTEKKGKEFLEEFFQMLADAAFESADPELIEAKKKLRETALAAIQKSKEKLKSMK